MVLKTYLEAVQDYVRTQIANNEHDSIFVELMEVSDQYLPERAAQQLVQFSLLNKAREERDLKYISEEAYEIKWSKATRFLTDELDALIQSLLKWALFREPGIQAQLNTRLKAYSTNLHGLKLLLKWALERSGDPQTTEGPTVTLLYAPEDKAYAYQLKKALYLLEKQGYFQLIDLAELLDRQTEFAQRSRLTLLLISNAFMFHFFDRISELDEAGCRMVPILISRTDLTDSRLGTLRSLPVDGVPVNEYPQPESAFTQIGMALRDFFKGQTST